MNGHGTTFLSQIMHKTRKIICFIVNYNFFHWKILNLFPCHMSLDKFYSIYRYIYWYVKICNWTHYHVHKVYTFFIWIDSVSRQTSHRQKKVVTSALYAYIYLFDEGSCHVTLFLSKTNVKYLYVWWRYIWCSKSVKFQSSHSPAVFGSLLLQKNLLLSSIFC